MLGCNVGKLKCSKEGYGLGADLTVCTILVTDVLRII